MGNKLGQQIKKVAGVVTQSEGSMISSEIWISPKHWKAMADDKKALVVDMFHRSEGYTDKFPFENMTTPSSDYYGIGITFSIGGNSLKGETTIELFKTLKIPHLMGTYDEVSTARKKLMPKVDV